MDIDWGSLSFGYIKTPYRFVSDFKDGIWDEGHLSEDCEIHISESAGVLQYAQTVFEGMKAYKTPDGRTVCFRPDLNAERMKSSCKRMEMPVYPVRDFLKAVREVVRANADYVPPYGTGASLYIRPFMFGSDAVLGVKPSNEYQFRIFCSPVGPYFKGGVRPVRLRVCDLDRAAPRGTGHIKAGLNYAMSLQPVMEAHRLGYDENLYLDPASRNFIEETGGANILFVTRDGRVLTPRSDSILPSVTRRSLIYIAEKYLGIEVEQRRIAYDELPDFVECGLCGTAAVISPVGSITDRGLTISFPGTEEGLGPVTKQLYDAIRSIQMGTLEAPEGWIMEI